MSDISDKLGDSISTKTYRFKVSNKLYQEMIDFAEFHKFEDKVTLKENFEKWSEEPEIMSMIQDEENILRRQNYDLEKNNIQRKIYKSIKYYLIKNMLKSMELQPEQQDKTKNSTNIKKNKNIKFSKELIDTTKQFLLKHINDPEFKPSKYFQTFCENNKELVESNIQEIIENEDYENVSQAELDFKMKKMFKNQYFSMFKLNNCK